MKRLSVNVFTTLELLNFLYFDLFSGYEKNAELLIKNGADVNLANKNGATPLDIAAFNGSSIFPYFESATP